MKLNRSVVLTAPAPLACPVCGAMSPQWHRHGSRLVCDACGWEERLKKHGGLRRLVALAAIGIVVILGFLGWQAAMWRPFGWEAFLLRTKTALSFATHEDLARLGAICNTLERHECSVDVYTRLLRARPDDPGIVANLAFAHTRISAHEVALLQYERYFRLGGGALDAIHGYAASLRSVGRVREAIEWYYRTLQVDPNLLDVTTELVELLVQQERHVEALSVIGAFTHRLPAYRTYWAGNIEAIDAALDTSERVGTQSKRVLQIPALGDHHFVPVKLGRQGAYNFFMVDSGASLLSVPPEMARGAGAQVRSLGRVVLLQTASGVIPGDAVTLPEVYVGPARLQNVEAVVCDCAPLLGQSALRRFDTRTERRQSVEFLLLTPR